MAQIPIQSGYPYWIDWSQNVAVLRVKWTLEQSVSYFLTNALAVFAGNFVAGQAWSIAAFVSHQFLASKHCDGLQALHRLVWRNTSDPFKAAWDLLRFWYVFREKDPSKQPPRIIWRTFRVVVIALFLWVGFIAASIVSSYVVISSAPVRIKAGPLGVCGIWKFELQPSTAPTPDIVLARIQEYQIKVANDTILARDYARSCYSQAFAGVNTASCGFYVIRSLPYDEEPDDSHDGQCPFGDTDFDQSPCNSTNNTGSHLMASRMIDSNDHLGINAPLANRVRFQKNVTCSVINADKYVTTSPGYNTQPGNQTYSFYQMGAIGPQGRLRLGISSPLDNPALTSNYTFLYNPAASQFPVGYQTNAVEYFAGAPNLWDAIPDFRVSDGDTTLVFLTANAIKYITPVYDPFFLATSAGDAFPGSGLTTIYSAYNPVAVMGCVDRYQICNPLGNCTGIGGIYQTLLAADNLKFNAAQRVTARRITVMLQNTNTYSNLFGSSTSALLASNQVFGYVSAPLPIDQWIVEVRDWFETGLAKMQSYAVEYAFNDVSLGQYGVVEFPDVDDETRPEWEYQCANQKISNPGQYQVFSVFGLLFSFIVGAAIIVLSWFVDWICLSIVWASGLIRHKAHLPPLHYPGLGNSQKLREHQWKADSKYQLFAMLMKATQSQLNASFPHYIPIYDRGAAWPEPSPSGVEGLLQYPTPLVSLAPSSANIPPLPPTNPPAPRPPPQPSPQANLHANLQADHQDNTTPSGPSAQNFPPVLSSAAPQADPQRDHQTNPLLTVPVALSPPQLDPIAGPHTNSDAGDQVDPHTVSNQSLDDGVASSSTGIVSDVSSQPHSHTSTQSP